MWLVSYRQPPASSCFKGLVGNQAKCVRSQLKISGGTTMKIALWGSAANQVGNDTMDCDSIPRPVLVVVCSTFVKNYQGRITLSSTNATKVYADADIPEVVEMRERPPRDITVPIKKGKIPVHIYPDNRKTISQLLSAKWDLTCQAANVLICSATATHPLIENGWHYLALPPCSKKVMGDDGDLWCTKCESRVEMPIARFMVRFEVDHHTGTTVFVAWMVKSKNCPVLPQLSS
ncbi:replication protein A 70 kDa DNA-binding subunit C-like isoform X1 [Papaver somniferum]|uniref:replication protein A 70 kDa DNA-binding subunit C-like isoform X1 n=1 Tax=Papaver somniferum TaxID=3469 RepID=UPI000E6FFE9D|nr:replication protein A 70 kDa DNA-binding subunit C-like isoform X1 [Papaver somniferum]XP_026408764.1 replication protein A 70 kDa DNA-binding subunit C-like isoform X1 [Papaver somniferum]